MGRQAMITAQKQHQQQAMNNIWQQNQNKQPQHVQPQDFRTRNGWNAAANIAQQQQQPGSAQRAFNVDPNWQQQQQQQQQQWNQQHVQPGAAPRNQWPPSPHNWN